MGNFLGFGQNLKILNGKTVTLSRQFVAVKRTYWFFQFLLSGSNTGTSVVGQANKQSLFFL